MLKHWIDYDLVNLSRIRNGMPTMFVPHDYETNILGVPPALPGWVRP